MTDSDPSGSPSHGPSSRPPDPRRQFTVAAALFVATCASTTFVGGFAYSIPVMAILLAHELGHYITARIHRVPASPPYFIPFPLPPLGTMGAVIAMPDRIKSRNALLDIGAAGPLAGMVVTIPVLVYGILESVVAPIGEPPLYLEGHSLFYELLLHLLKGPIPDGYDIHLTATGQAGWTGLLVTMINLIPVAQLDGGHVCYALFGHRQALYSRRVRNVLPYIGFAVGLYYGLPVLDRGQSGEPLFAGFAAGLPWLMWWALLRFMVSRSGMEHPPTDGAPLSPGRRVVAWFTLALFAILFMPFWMRQVL